MSENLQELNEKTRESLIRLSVESWRFSRLFSRLLSKIDAGEAPRYVNQYRYYIKQLEDNLEASGLKLVNIEGQIYDTGMATTALNVGDFGPDDQLVVDQMLEPIIMGDEGIIRTGTVMLRKAD